MSDAEPKFHCDRCLRGFKRQCDLNRHLNGKKKCAPVAEKVEKIIQEEVNSRVQVEVNDALATNSEPATTETALRRIVFHSRDILRKAGVIEKDAFDCIVLTFILRELEKLYPQLTDPANYNVDKPFVSPDIRYCVESKVHCFSAVVNAAFDQYDGKKCNWDGIIKTAFLSPSYCESMPRDIVNMIRSIANVEKGVVTGFARLQDSKVAYDLVQHVNTYSGDLDLLGRVLMSIMREGNLGNELGQHFTPEPVIECAMNAIMEDNYELGDVIDPTCGSGLFLIHAIRRGAKSVSGVEISPQAYPLTCINLLSELKSMPTGIKKGDILATHNLPQFDSIVTNPPFGVKGIKLADLVKTDDGKDIYPVGSSATGFFLMKIISLLKVGGRAVVVLPLGRELSGSSNVDVNFRKLILKALNIRKIIVLPPKSFRTAAIETVIMVFEKAHELKDCVKEVRKKYAVDNAIENSTTNIRIGMLTKKANGELNNVPEDMTKEYITIDEIIENHFSLNPKDYATAIGEERQAAPETGYPMATVGDLFDFEIGGTPLTSTAEYYSNTGYPWVSISDLNYGIVTDTAKKISDAGIRHSSVKLVKAGTLLCSFKLTIGKVATAGVDLYTNEAIAALTPKGNNIDQQYAKYAISTGSCEISGVHGLIGTGSLNKKSFSKMKIPLPPLEIQQRIVEYLDKELPTNDLIDLAKYGSGAFTILLREPSGEKFSDILHMVRAIRKNDDDVQSVKRFMKTVCDNIEFRPDVQRLTVGDLFTLKKGTIQSSKSEPGEYPLLSMSLINTHNVATEFDETLVITTTYLGGGLSGIRIFYNNGPCAISTVVAKFIPRDAGKILIKYAYYYLNSMSKTIAKNCEKGLCGKTLDKVKFLSMLIPVPQIEIQQQIVELLDSFQAHISNLETVKKSLVDSIAFVMSCNTNH